MNVPAILTLMVTLAPSALGHGRLMDPPARNAMWRAGYPNPVNYNDNELYCGGFIIHSVTNKGKCGVCGDDYRDPVPRSHEAGGTFSNGFIARKYVVGQVVKIVVDLTTNHKGVMKLELCQNNNKDVIATDECFAQNILPLTNGGGDEFVIPEDTAKSEIFEWTVQLPAGVSCTNCVMRWTYKTGNTWGTCPNGTESIGCGNQETFINCADVVINTNTPTGDVNPWQLYVKGEFPGNVATNEIGVIRQDIVPLVVRSQLCIPLDQYKNETGIEEHCLRACLTYVPTHCTQKCRCVHDCTAIGEFGKLPDADIWCHQNCLKHPSFCPAERCVCN